MGASSMPEKLRTEEDEMKDIEEMINKKTFKEMQKSGEELLDLIHRPTVKESANALKFKIKGGSRVKEYCHLLTKEDCRRHFSSYIACEKVHFRCIIATHTDKDLGDCSFLDTCHHTKTIKYDHYELDPTPDIPPTMMGTNQPPKPGQFGVIMEDPPWNIHMELPYCTRADDELRTLNVLALQTDGLIFLWVTGRALELGREWFNLSSVVRPVIMESV